MKTALDNISDYQIKANKIRAEQEDKKDTPTYRGQ